jgi:hypothetical protein
MSNYSDFHFFRLTGQKKGNDLDVFQTIFIPIGPLAPLWALSALSLSSLSIPHSPSCTPGCSSAGLPPIHIDSELKFCSPCGRCSTECCIARKAITWDGRPRAADVRRNSAEAVTWEGFIKDAMEALDDEDTSGSSSGRP